MATVTQIEDKNGNLFDIEDSDARTEISEIKTNIENIIADYLTLTDEPDSSISLNDGYSATTAQFPRIIKYGKIKMLTVYIDNITGTNIGTSTAAYIGKTNHRPKTIMQTMLFDYVSAKITRFNIYPNGDVILQESNDIIPGNNKIRGSIIIFED